MDWNTLEQETERTHHFGRIFDEVLDKIEQIDANIFYEEFDDLRNDISRLLSKLEEYVRGEYVRGED